MSGAQNLLVTNFSAAAPAGPSDPYFEYVQTLLPGTGTNGADNNTFIDSSTNNFSSTRYGNTTQGSFSPFIKPNGYWSNYFDGNDTITFGHISAYNPNTYVSLECFVYFNSLGTNQLVVGRQGMWISYDYSAIGTTSGKIGFSMYDGSSWAVANSTTTIQLYTWYHVVGIRDNTTLRLYINGTQEHTATFSGSPASYTTDFAIGSTYTGGGNFITGYVSNVRYCNGATSGALPYTGNFSPVTTPLTATSATVLLTCQSNRWLDNSTNDSTPLLSGSPSVQAFGPFNPPSVYSSSTNGGSIFFNNTGDYLELSNNSVFAFGTGDFTVEFFYYGRSSNGGFGSLTGGSTGYWACNMNAGTIYWQDAAGSSNKLSLSATNLTNSAWNHFAIVRNSGTLRFFLNGISVASTTDNTNYNGTGGNLIFGRDLNVNYLRDYISSYRIVKGTAVYPGSSSFTPPTAPLTAISGTSLLLNGANAGIYDAAAKINYVTKGVDIDTGQTKWGGGAMFFNKNNTEYLLANTQTTVTTQSHPNYAKLGFTFTIEFWMYRTSTDSNQWIVNTGQGYNTQSGFLIGYYDLYASGSIAVAGDSLGAYWFGGNTFVTANAWHHVAVVGDGTNCNIYLDGSRIGQQAWPGSGYTGPNAYGWIIGSGSSDIAGSSISSPFGGYIQDFRVTQGIARYSGTTYTVPTASFPLY